MSKRHAEFPAQKLGAGDAQYRTHVYTLDRPSSELPCETKEEAQLRANFFGILHESKLFSSLVLECYGLDQTSQKILLEKYVTTLRGLYTHFSHFSHAERARWLLFTLDFLQRGLGLFLSEKNKENRYCDISLDTVVILPAVFPPRLNQENHLDQIHSNASFHQLKLLGTPLMAPCPSEVLVHSSRQIINTVLDWCDFSFDLQTRLGSICETDFQKYCTKLKEELSRTNVSTAIISCLRSAERFLPFKPDPTHKFYLHCVLEPTPEALSSSSHHLVVDALVDKRDRIEELYEIQICLSLCSLAELSRRNQLRSEVSLELISELGQENDLSYSVSFHVCLVWVVRYERSACFFLKTTEHSSLFTFPTMIQCTADRMFDPSTGKLNPWNCVPSSLRHRTSLYGINTNFQTGSVYLSGAIEFDAADLPSEHLVSIDCNIDSLREFIAANKSKSQLECLHSMVQLAMLAYGAESDEDAYEDLNQLVIK